MHERALRFPSSFRTKRLFVRPIEMKDAGEWKRLNNRIAKRLSLWPIVPSIVYARNEILHYQGMRKKGTGSVYVVLDGTTGDVMGDFRFKQVHRKRRRLEIGHALDPAWWGSGRNQELLRAACAFAKRARYTLYGRVDVKNVRSWRSLEKFGAHYTGTRLFSINGARVRLRVYDF